MDTILITRPNHDLGTTYLFFWSKIVIDFARLKSKIVLDLNATKANLKNLTSYISKNSPNLLFFNGHGNDNAIYGQNNIILVDPKTDPNIVKNRIIYSRCCSSGAKLGKTLIRNGAKTFIGYNKSFFFYLQKGKQTQPLDDQIAKRFLEPSNLVVISLLKGRTAKQAHEKSIKNMWKNYSYFISSDADHEERSAAPYLFNNITGQVLFGDPEAKI